MADFSPFGNTGGKENISSSDMNRYYAQMGRDLGNILGKTITNYFMTGKASVGGYRNTFASQSIASDRIFGNNGGRNGAGGQYKRTVRGGLDGFEDGIKEELLKGIFGPDFEKGLKSASQEVVKQFGVSLREIPNEVGKQVARNALNSDLGKAITNKVKTSLIGEGGKGGILDSLSSKGDLGKAVSQIGKAFIENAGSSAATAAEGFEAAGTAATTAAGSMATAGATATEGTLIASESMATAMTTAAGPIAELAVAVPPVLIALAAIAVALEVAGPAIEGFVAVLKAMGNAASRNDQERAKRLENAQARLKADVDILVKQPFEILNKAAEQWYNAWDSNLKAISQTQGYNKEDVYNLYSSYAERLTAEGLNTVISATSIIDQLKGVLDTGLSGKAAEEFAYVATKLNSAIPNENFFDYASTYAELAANAIAQGASQEEALQLANQQLETFASNLLYSSRELAGGFSTGLKGASSLFSDAVKIAQSAKSGNVSNISGTLTSVSAIIGAIAPDLASGLVDNIVQAAIGGNSDTIVALRSLAGINASNTEFLKAMADDPQSVFANLFNKLAELQNMSNSNFMEVAEGLSSVFGVDKSAFARVDFNYLADAITQMNVNQNSLNENLKLLASGESTTTAEQTQMAKINEMILNDGLSVVLDNAVARTVQQHLWDEQMANDIMSAEYAVSLQGAALQFLEGISQTIVNIIRFLNPLGTISEVISNIAETVADTAEQQSSLATILEKGAIKTNTQTLANLMNYTGSAPINVFGEGLDNVNTRLKTMLFGDAESSLYGGMLSNIASATNTYSNIVNSISTGRDNDLVSAIGQAGTNLMITAGLSNSTNSDITSSYSWGTVGKSASRMRSALTKAGNSYVDEIVSTLTEDPNKEKVRSAFETLFGSAEEAQASLDFEWDDDLGQYVANRTSGKSVNEWVQNTFEPLYNALDSATRAQYDSWENMYAEYMASYGTNEEQIRGYYQSMQSKAQSEVTQRSQESEMMFYEEVRRILPEIRKFWDFSSATTGLYETVIWNPFFTALSTFWGYSGGNFYTQYWQKFYDDGMKFDQGISTILSEMVNERDNWIGMPSAEGTVRGLLDTINSTLLVINDNVSDWVRAWTDYYINHTTYTERTTSADWTTLVDAENAQSRDTALSLAKSLEALSNLDDLMDPTVQSNVLLAKIVVILETMMQQNNTTGGLSLIDSLSAMSLGLTNRT